ncbi:hypothetical protein [Dermatophilus congolensis]|uniref:hypothetical protein n=1 Tax=Dermatophilus congolensis TaxID=1863 RepID=UPI001AAE1D7C|nr:hypothetical protein [Dermatophilus congolensis]MBO3142324.1 hypothetical protein [Dermatophilus congolensis]MBO3151315.1 hypothetical protein [Dermatophilus congolensis]MBO3161681.1 hypothetical protein [Dermatophilus congolensis]MBO3162601.1 hypothetical protein [Dermatophilus congolensis]MBO3176154.1 hypothetical protein [Dermatophilus congolensis]
MLIIDVRLPQPVTPPVPAVVKADASATSTSTERLPVIHRGERRVRRSSAPDTSLLSAADIELIHVVTGERLYGTGIVNGEDLQPFSLQLVLDRHDGVLPRGVEVSVSYLHRRGKALLRSGHLNPYSGAELTRAERYLASRHSGGVDVSL